MRDTSVSLPSNSTARSKISVLIGCAALIAFGPAFGQSDDEEGVVVLPHMTEELRASVTNIIVIPGYSPPSHELTGTYDKDQAGFYGGYDAGSRVGTVSTDVGHVPVNIPIPVVSDLAAILGGISGAYMRELQEFRDALTEDLTQAADQPLRSESLAQDVYHGLRSVPNLKPRIFSATTPIPEDTETVFFVAVDGVNIDVQGKDAILTTTARTTLRRLSDGKKLDERIIQYQDRDSLGNWTEDDNALWHAYANYARHFLGREISAQVFGRVELEHELMPQPTDSVSKVKRRDWEGVTKSTTPTLAWELNVTGGNYGPWIESIDESNTFYDLEIYDERTLVYAEERLPEAQHTLAWEIEDCKTYRWSVRPSYRVGDDIKYGEWMRFEREGEDNFAKGALGRKASEAPAYIQEFASLEIKCGRR